MVSEDGDDDITIPIIAVRATDGELLLGVANCPTVSLRYEWGDDDEETSESDDGSFDFESNMEGEDSFEARHQAQPPNLLDELLMRTRDRPVSPLFKPKLSKAERAANSPQPQYRWRKMDRGKPARAGSGGGVDKARKTEPPKSQQQHQRRMRGQRTEAGRGVAATTPRIAGAKEERREAAAVEAEVQKLARAKTAADVALVCGDRRARVELEAEEAVEVAEEQEPEEEPMEPEEPEDENQESKVATAAEAKAAAKAAGWERAKAAAKLVEKAMRLEVLQEEYAGGLVPEAALKEMHEELDIKFG